MLTARGWWFLTTSLIVALLGILALGWYAATVPILGLTLAIGFFVEWVVFVSRVRAADGRILVERELLQGGRVVPVAWAGSAVTVRITVTLLEGYRLPFVVLRDKPPADVPRIDGGPALPTPLLLGEPAIIEYTLKPPSAGVMRFEGVQVRIADLAGFFYRRLFLRDPVDVLILPPLTDDEGQRCGMKRFNTLPPPGVHRLRRPGSGSELHDLREYRPGDPPKMIAWKPSARRDRLITKEFESEVPVRCVLFLDASNSVRLGATGQSPLAKLANVAAGVAQASAATRDLVGLSIFDEHESNFTSPARTQPHLIRMLRQLAEASGRLPEHGIHDPVLLTKHAYPLARELYPDLLETDVNSRPLGMFWLPIVDSRLLWIVLFLVFWPFLMMKIEVLELVAKFVIAVSPAGRGWITFLWMLSVPSVIAFFIWFLHGVRGWFAPRSTRLSQRKQLAALYALHDQTGPAAIERFLYDDGLFAERTARFLLEHRVTPPLTLYDTDGKFRYRSNGKIAVLADAITRAVSRARDNELYVILADLAELGDELDPLIAAARMARGRHHQMLVLVPWPADIPPPDDVKSATVAGLGKNGRLRIGAVLRAGITAKYHRGYEALRTAMSRAGVQVIRIEDGDPVQRVLDRLDRLRGVRVR